MDDLILLMQIRFECHYHNSLKVILFYENSSTGNKVFLLPPEIINVRFFGKKLTIKT